MSMEVWSNPNNTPSVTPPANEGPDPLHAMPTTAEPPPPALNAFDNSIFASLISENDEKTLVDLKPEVILNADLQIGSGTPKPDLGSLYGGFQSNIQASTPYGVTTTHCTVIPVASQLRGLASQSTCITSYPSYSYASTRYLPHTSVCPQYMQPSPISMGNNRGISHQHLHSFSSPLLRSHSSFTTSASPNFSNYTVWQKCLNSPHHRSIPTAVRKASRSYSGMPCAVCGAPATGKRYGAVSCDSCSAFFGVATLLGIQCECSNKPSPSDDAYHLHCHYCMLTKCLAVGMCKEAVQFEKSHEDPTFSNVQDYLNLMPPVTSAVCSYGGTNNSSGSRLSSVTAATVEQIGKAESLVFDVPPLDLPEGKPIFAEENDWSSLQTNVEESIINLVLWSQQIPLFSEFSESDRFTLLRAGCIQLLLVHFIFRLANSLSESHSPTSPWFSNSRSQKSFSSTSVAPVESTAVPPTSPDIPVLVADALFPVHSAPEYILFSQQAESDLRNAGRWHESRVLMNILPVDEGYHPIGITSVSNELNAQCLSRRRILCRIFDLARLFKRLCLSVEALGCLRMVILFNPGGYRSSRRCMRVELRARDSPPQLGDESPLLRCKVEVNGDVERYLSSLLFNLVVLTDFIVYADLPELTEETRERVESRRDEAFVCLEHTLVRADQKTALGRMAQMCLNLADLSFVAEVIYSKTSPNPFLSLRYLAYLLECFYKSDTTTTVSEPNI
ncbi:unnamed protein product [Hydatigera taeniaeformis]|uniref:Retinoic acid receptor RXR n=1 Tax=Hydatigena taeniaeformis TaxID=6205 RepID=A0A0R3X2V7_HYDTA|nr:unnamed protein product [Hydatigera taeniaeformis]